MKTDSDTTKRASGYAPVNGLQMYYEIQGTGDPLVYIPPAFSHNGMNSFPALADGHSVLTVDLQGHGRTADLPERPLSIRQHAEDVAALLQFLEIPKADLFGESYGGAIAAMVAVQHPELTRRVATYGATFGAAQVAVDAEMLRTSQPPTPDSRSVQFQREQYKQVAPHAGYWPEIWGKVTRMKWDGFSREELASLQTPILIALGDHDFVRLEHALETFRLIPHAELAVIPDAGHFALFSEQDRVIPAVTHFLRKPDARIPIATGETGYRPGETR